MSGGSNPSRPIKQKSTLCSAWIFLFYYRVRCRAVGTNLPFACRGEHCSPVAFARWVALTGWLHGRSMTAPTRQHILCCVWLFRQVCRGRIYASRAVYPLYRNIRVAARAAYMPPLRSTRNVVIAVISRGVFYCPVGRGDPTPPRSFAIAAKLHGTVKTVPYK